MADNTLADALSLVSKISSSTNKRLSLLEKVLGKSAPKSKDGAPAKEPRQVVKKAEPVIVTDFGRKAEQDLGRLGGDPGQGGAGGKGEGGKGAGGIGKLLGGALLVLGGLAALVQGLMTDGPLKGLLKILAKGGIIGGIKLFASSAGKALKGFGKQFAKIMPKNLFKNVITAAKGFLGKIGKFLLGPFTKIAGKGGGKALFGTIGKLFMKFLKPVLKRIPGIGSLISWGFAISRFKSGDLVGGLIDVASGIATLFPGIGTGISIGLDVLNAFLDVKKGKDDKIKPEGAPGGIGEFFGKIKDTIMNNFPIKNLVQFYSGVGDVLTGNFKEGFTKMAFALPFMSPLADFLFGKKDEEGERSGGAALNFKKFFGGIKNKMLGMLLKMVPEKILGVSVRSRVAKLLGFEAGEIKDEPNAGPDYEDPRDPPRRQFTEEEKAQIDKETEGMSFVEKMAYREKKRKELSALETQSNDVNISGQAALGSSAILKATADGNDLIKDLRDSNNNLLEMQIDLLRESTTLLREISEKTNGGGNNIITTNNTSVSNSGSQRSIRDLQEMYA